MIFWIYIQGSHGLWRSLRVWEKQDRLFEALEVLEWGLWKFVNFVVFRALGKNYQLISQKLHFPRPDSRLKCLKKNAESQRMYFLSVLTAQFWLIECVGYNKGCAPLPDVQIVAYLHIAFLHHIASIMSGFVKSLWILKGFFCTNPVNIYNGYLIVSAVDCSVNGILDSVIKWMDLGKHLRYACVCHFVSVFCF